MKTLIPFLLLGMFFLGCTETIYEEIIKVDTVFVSKPQSLVPTFITAVDTIVVRDTVDVTIVIRDTVINNIYTTDTVYQVVTKDSVIIQEIEKVIYHTDTVLVTIVELDTIVKEITVHDTVTLTVYDRTVIYLDTAVVVSYMRPTESIPEDILPHVMEFNQLAQQYDKQPTLGVMIIQYVEELPGEGWSSNSFQISDNSQIVIQLDQRYPAALHRAGVFREMARMGLNKKYTNITDRIMNPVFPPEATITTNHLNQLFK